MSFAKTERSNTQNERDQAGRAGWLPGVTCFFHLKIPAGTFLLPALHDFYTIFCFIRGMEDSMNILAIGDVVGTSGCDFLRQHLSSLKKLYSIDLCIVNGENSADGNGITPS
jgi:hypothetical protein